MHATSLRASRRSTGHPRTPRRRSSTAIVMLAAGLLLAACTFEPDAPGVPDAPAPAPAPAPDDDAPDPDETPEPAAELAVYLVRSGPTDFFVEPILVPVEGDDAPGDGIDDRIAAAIDALLGVTTPQDVDLFTSVPENTTLVGVDVTDGIATIDLTGGIIGSPGSSSQEITFAQQLAHTAAVDATIVGIRLAIDGTEVDELWGHLDWSVPIEPDPFALSPITIAEPAAGETVNVGEVTFRGEATVFEATVLVTLFDEGGETLEEGFVTATAGGPERGTWEWTVTLPGTGLYTMLAEETDPSEGEGRPPFETTRTIRAAE